jgi:hypothetical protein
MDKANWQSFAHLFDRMETDSSLKGAGKQLACISKLVFYCGVQEREVPKLLIRDVRDNEGNIIMEIRKFDKHIFLTDEAAESITRHIDEMSRRNPSLVKRRSPLFPAYRNTRKLRRHWKSFGTTYTQIHQAGIHYFYQNGLSAGELKGRIYESGSLQKRISERQFQAVALNQKIPAGRSVDDRCVDEILGLIEQAERVNKNNPNAKTEARRILAEFKKTIRKIRSTKLRERFASLRSNLDTLLKDIF